MRARVPAKRLRQPQSVASIKGLRTAVPRDGPLVQTMLRRERLDGRIPEQERAAAAAGAPDRGPGGPAGFTQLGSHVNKAGARGSVRYNAGVVQQGAASRGGAY